MLICELFIAARHSAISGNSSPPGADANSLVIQLQHVEQLIGIVSPRVQLLVPKVVVPTLNIVAQVQGKEQRAVPQAEVVPALERQKPYVKQEMMGQVEKWEVTE